MTFALRGFSRPSCLLVLFAAIGGTSGRLAAADLFAYRDLRLGVATVGAASEVTSTTAGVTTTAKDRWSSARRVSLDAVFDVDLLLIGLAGGVGVVQEHRAGTGRSEDAFVGRLQAGPTLEFGPVTFELLAQAGTGNATLKQDGADDSSAARTEIGATFNVIFPVPVLPVVVGASVGVLKTDSSHSFSNGGVPTDVKLADADYTAGLLVGWRF